MTEEYLIGSRVLTSFHHLTKELDNDKNYLFELSYLAVLSLQGAKTIEFLQGQMSSDVSKLTENCMIPGALCNLQGRILTLLNLIMWQGPKIILPEDLLLATQNSLSKTAMLSRISLKTETHLKIYGFYLQNSGDILPPKASFPQQLHEAIGDLLYYNYSLGDGFYIFIIKDEFEEEFCKPFITVDQLLGSLPWHTLRLMHYQIEIYKESTGQILPHHLGLHKTPYLSFNKGCYKGQEVIARMHYRATIKHELKVFIINSSEALFLGQKLMSKGGEVGQLVDYSYLCERRYLIAVSILKTAPSTLFLENHEYPVDLQPPSSYLP